MQFVNFTSIMEKSVSLQQKEAAFALAALMEVPLQYKATIELGLLGLEPSLLPNFQLLFLYEKNVLPRVLNYLSTVQIGV